MVSFWLLVLVAPFVAVTAGPVVAEPWTEEYPEVIPGPGLPSLKSLGLTSADLYRMAPRHNLTTRGLEKRGTCQTNAQVSQSGAAACHQYLYNIGSHTCTVTTNVAFCTSGNAQVGGTSLSGQTSSVLCGYVSNSVADILNHCTACGGSCVQGYENCPQNTNIVVSIELVGGNPGKL